MPFSKSYFENLSKLLENYFNRFPCGNVTVTLRAYHNDYNLQSMLAVGEDAVTFTHYDNKKTLEVPGGTDITKSRAYPALSLPYEAIESVEFNPAVPTDDNDERTNSDMVQSFKAGGWKKKKTP